MLLNQDVVFLEVLEDQIEFNFNGAGGDCRQLETVDACVHQIFFDEGEAAGVESLLDRVDHAERLDSPSRDFDTVESGLGG